MTYGLIALGANACSIGRAYLIVTIFIILLFSACLWLMKRGVGIRE